jgi:uncharacterized protein
MSEFLSDDELKRLDPAETCASESPIPTRPISNGEFFPGHQSGEQQQVEALIKDYGDSYAKKLGMERRQFLKTAAGMAAAFLAMNKVHGWVFDVTPAEAATPELAAQRASRYADQFIVDIHTHFVRDDCRLLYLLNLREFTGRAGYNPELAKEPQTMDNLKFGNYVKEMFLDSDTKIALLSGAPSDIPRDWLLTNQMIADARRKVNTFAGSKRMLGHAVIAPGQKGWLEDIDRAIEEIKPDAWKATPSVTPPTLRSADIHGAWMTRSCSTRPMRNSSSLGLIGSPSTRACTCTRPMPKKNSPISNNTPRLTTSVRPPKTGPS